MPSEKQYGFPCRSRPPLISGSLQIHCDLISIPGSVCENANPRRDTYFAGLRIAPKSPDHSSTQFSSTYLFIYSFCRQLFHRTPNTKTVVVADVSYSYLLYPLSDYFRCTMYAQVCVILIFGASYMYHSDCVS